MARGRFIPPRGKKRGTLRGGRGGKPRRIRRGARVVDPGLFYALRACAKVALAVAEGREPDPALKPKLHLWTEQADAWWQTQVRVRESEPEGRKLPSEVAPGESNSSAGRHIVRTVRKPGAIPEVPTVDDILAASFQLDEEEEVDED